MNVPEKALFQSRQTIRSYEKYAERYDALVGQVANPFDQGWLKRLVSIAGENARILEVGSGPGREADFLETLGPSVRRTDATRKFIEIQAARGNQVELLDIITDEFGGPYDGIVGLCVLIHVPCAMIDTVLAKVVRALRPEGAFLVSLRNGDGESDDGKYHTVYWRRDDFVSRLEAAGLNLVRDEFSVCSDGDEWNTFLAVRPS